MEEKNNQRNLSKDQKAKMSKYKQSWSKKSWLMPGQFYWFRYLFVLLWYQRVMDGTFVLNPICLENKLKVILNNVTQSIFVYESNVGQLEQQQLYSRHPQLAV